MVNVEYMDNLKHTNSIPLYFYEAFHNVDCVKAILTDKEMRINYINSIFEYHLGHVSMQTEIQQFDLSSFHFQR